MTYFADDESERRKALGKVFDDPGTTARRASAVDIRASQAEVDATSGPSVVVKSSHISMGDAVEASR